MLLWLFLEFPMSIPSLRSPFYPQSNALGKKKSHSFTTYAFASLNSKFFSLSLTAHLVKTS